MSSLKKRLLSRLEKQGDCLVWTGAIRTDGYGAIWNSFKMIATHRAAYLIEHGELPDDMVIRHTCDNPPCCNVNHLIAGTTQDNVDDKYARSRGNLGVDHGMSKLTDDDVKNIRDRYATGKVSQRKLGKEFNVDQALISKIVNNKLWKHL